MKKPSPRLLTASALVLATVLLAACATTDKGQNNTPSSGTGVHYADLQHHSYVLQTFNGNPLTGNNKTRQPRIDFNENMNISGVVCNNFTGQATLTNSTLKARAASTMMMCPDNNLNTAEQALFKALENGAKISLNNEGKSLTLKEGNNTFIYQLQDYIK